MKFYAVAFFSKECSISDIFDAISSNSCGKNFEILKDHCIPILSAGNKNEIMMVGYFIRAEYYRISCVRNDIIRLKLKLCGFYCHGASDTYGVSQDLTRVISKWK